MCIYSCIYPVDFIKEAYRLLRPDGRFIITTPNVLNINSRLSYLLSGFFVLFGPVSLNKDDSGGLLGHIMPLSYYYLDYFMRNHGFLQVELLIDKIKRSALLYYSLLFPLIRPASLIRRINISKKNPGLFEKNREQIKLMNCFKIFCSRSCILVGYK